MIKEYKFTIIFILVILAIIAAIVIVDITGNKGDEKPVYNVSGKESDETNELIEPTKYQDIGDKHPIATITMNDGKKIVIKLYPEIAPITVENFISLANSGYYNGLTFHRTIPDFMVQGGDKEGTGRGVTDYTIVGEFEENGYKNELSHKEGVISMARKSYPNDSACSQFFITVADCSYSLDGKYAAFGEVLEGMDVVHEIEDVEVVTREQSSFECDRPIDPPVIKNISVETFGIKYDEPEKIK